MYLLHLLGECVGKTDGVNLSLEPVLMEAMAPSSSNAGKVCRSYIDAFACKYSIVRRKDEEINTALREDPATTQRHRTACSSWPIRGVRRG
jgi:hypothetical protein